MQNPFLKQLGKSAKDAAVKSAKQIIHEPAEMLKNTTSQINPSEKKQIAPEVSMIQELMTGGGKVKEVTQQEQESMHSKAKQRLQEIEAEIRRLRNEREQMSQEYLKSQEELLKNKERQEKVQEAVMPSSGRKKGPMGARDAKKGSQEVGRQYKG